MSAERSAAARRVMLSALILAAALLAGLLGQATTTGAVGAAQAADGSAALSRSSGELGLMPATPRSTLGKSESDRGDPSQGLVGLLAAAVVLFPLLSGRSGPPATAGVRRRLPACGTHARAPPVAPAA